MHLVFVTSLVPAGKPSTGYEIATAAIIAALRRAGAKVTVVGYVRPGETPADPEDTIVVGELDPATENAGLPEKLRWLTTSFRTGLPVSSAKLRRCSEEDFEQVLASAGKADAYILNAVQMAAAYEPAFGDKPALYVAHNVEHLSARDNARTARSLVRRFLFSREAELLETVEKRLCRNASFVFTLAEDDRHQLGVAQPDRSAALPLVTRTKAATPRPKRTVRQDAGLIGTWTWQPNLVGLEWFLDQVVPHLDPSFSVAVAGSAPSGLAEKYPAVRFVGRVADAGEFMRASAVVPLVSQSGTGVQLKTLEAFELGLPTVATTSSLRGIARVPSNCVVADDPQEFARAMSKLVASTDRDVDGGAFFRAQLRGLDEAVASGLKALGFGPEIVLV